MKEKLVSCVDNLDKAAVLVTMGFTCHGRHVVKDVDLGSTTGRRSCAYIWEFDSVAPCGLTLSEVCAEYAVGLPVGRCVKPLGAVAAARLALHNYRVLRKALKQGCTVWADDFLGCVRLGNYAGGQESREVRRVAAPVGGEYCRGEYAAVLTALGYVPESVCCCAGKVSVCLSARDGVPGVWQRVAMLRDEEWLHDAANLEPLAVALLAIRNRGWLVSEGQPGETLRVHKNGLVGLVGKAADERVKAELCRRLNA